MIFIDLEKIDFQKIVDQIKLSETQKVHKYIIFDKDHILI